MSPNRPSSLSKSLVANTFLSLVAINSNSALSYFPTPIEMTSSATHFNSSACFVMNALLSVDFPSVRTTTTFFDSSRAPQFFLKECSLTYLRAAPVPVLPFLHLGQASFPTAVLRLSAVV